MKSSNFLKENNYEDSDFQLPEKGKTQNKNKFNKNDEFKQKPIEDENGKKGYILNGKKEGYWAYYIFDGKLHTIGHYVNGEEDGYWEYYHGNGNLDECGMYVDGLRHGLWAKYAKTSRIKYEINNYFNGRLNGKTTLFDKENGKLIAYIYYKDNLFSKIQKFLENGKLNYECKYNDFKLGHAKKFYETGEVQATGDMIDDKPVYEWKEYDKNGNFIGIGRYRIERERNEIIGKNEEFLKYGYWEEFKDNTIQIGLYNANGKKDNFWDISDKNTKKLIRRERYSNGKLVDTIYKD